MSVTCSFPFSELSELFTYGQEVKFFAYNVVVQYSVAENL